MDYKQMICGVYCQNKHKANFRCTGCGELLKEFKISDEAKEAVDNKILVGFDEVYNKYMQNLTSEMLKELSNG